MSIRDFYSKLVGHEDNLLLASLRQLRLVEDASHFSGGSTGGPAGDWLVWTQNSEECLPAVA
jgi:hypothetical protein